VPDRSSERRADCPGIGAMPVGRHSVRPITYRRLCGAEEGLGGRHVAALAQHGVDQVSVPIDGSIQIGPFAPDLEVSLVGVPAGTRATPLPMPAFAEFLTHDRQQLRFPVPDGLVAHIDAP
jgi:hypothetical protein